MVLSMGLGRGYARIRHLVGSVVDHVAKEGPQLRERPPCRDRFHCHMHRTASRSVQHPGRDFLNLHDRRFRQAAPSHRAAAPFDHLVQEDDSPGPRMPFITNPNLATASDTMGLVEGSCTTAAGRIRALTGRRRTRPISTGCRTSRRPEPGRPPLNEATDAVETNRATSVRPRARSSKACRLVRQIRDHLLGRPRRCQAPNPAPTGFFNIAARPRHD